MAFTQQVLCASLPEGTSVAGRLGSDNAIEAEPSLHRRSRPKFLQDRFERVAAIAGGGRWGGRCREQSFRIVLGTKGPGSTLATIGQSQASSAIFEACGFAQDGEDTAAVIVTV